MKIKKLAVLLFICIFSLAFGKEYSPIEKIREFHFQVKEINYTGQKKKEIHYDIFLKLPDQAKKIVSYPEMNKGETYIYEGENKIVYLPIFNQKTTSKIEKEENQVLQTIKLLLEKLKSESRFRNRYYEKEKIQLNLEDKYVASINEYTEVGTYLFPSRWSIEENGEKVLELYLSEIEISPKLLEKDFKIP